MANVKITDLTELTTLAATDIVEVVDDPAGTPLSRKMTMLNLVKAAMGLTSSDTFRIGAVLHDETLGGNGAFDVASLSQDYDDLQIIVEARGTVAALSDVVYLFFNNDTTVANYSSQYVQGVGTTAAAARGDTPTLGAVPAGTADAGYTGVYEIWLYDYTSGNTKQAVAHGRERRSATVQALWEVGIHWESTAAISRVQLRTDNHATDLFATGARLRIIGWKASG